MLSRKFVSQVFKGLVITVLYTTFFAVQLFFNFDLSFRKNSVQPDAIQNISAHQQAQYIFKYQKSVSVKNNIRLNKRFQPSNIPDCIFPCSDHLVEYAKVISVRYYYHESLICSVSLSEPKRGPPVIA